MKTFSIVAVGLAIIAPVLAAGVPPGGGCPDEGAQDCEYNGGHVMICSGGTWNYGPDCPPSDQHCVSGHCYPNAKKVKARLAKMMA